MAIAKGVFLGLLIAVLVHAPGCAGVGVGSQRKAAMAEKAIGSAHMEADGTIVLQLRAESPGGSIGDALFRYPPSDPDYSKILKHLGGLEKGQSKPVPPWTTSEEQGRTESNAWIRVEGGSWAPSDQVLSAIQRRLVPYLTAQEKVYKTSFRKPEAYRFQYQGRIAKDRRFVFINAFCRLPGGYKGNLSRDFVEVRDGGSCYFQLKYDPAAEQFFDLRVNGEA